jgi:signal transduction histidine kinase
MGARLKPKIFFLIALAVMLATPGFSADSANPETYRFWENTFGPPETAKVAQFGALNNFGLTFGKRIFLSIAVQKSFQNKLISLTDGEIATLAIYSGDGNPLGEPIVTYKDPLAGAIGIPFPSDPAIKNIVLEIKTKEFLALRPIISTHEELAMRDRVHVAAKVSVLTVILVISFLCFVGGFVFKMRMFIFFGSYSLGIVLLLVNYLGLSSLFFPTSSPYISDAIFLLSHTLTAGFFYCFIAEFLHLESVSPKVYQGFRLSLRFTWFISLVGLIFPSFSIFIIPLSGLVSGTLILLGALAAFRTSAIHIRVYLLSWILFLFFITLYTLSLVGISADYFLFGYELAIGTSLDIGMLLAAIVLKIRFDEVEKQKVLERERKQYETQSRLAALGLLAGGIAHEINNPLSIIKSAGSNLQFLLSKGVTDTNLLLKLAREIDGTVSRISELIRSLRVLASGRKNAADLQVLNLAQALMPITKLIEGHGMQQEAAFSISGWDEDKHFVGEMVSFSQIFTNLIANAIDASKNCVDRWIALDATATDEKIHIRISNSGKKLDQSMAANVFDPFFTTKNVGEGMGLGLSISKSLAESMGGTLEVDLAKVHTAFVLTFDRHGKRGI